MRLRFALLTAALSAVVAFGDDPLPTVDQAVAKSAEARKKEAAAKTEREAADKVLRDVLAALNAKLKELGLDVPQPAPPLPPGPMPTPPGPLDADAAKLQYALDGDKTEPSTKAKKLQQMAAAYRKAVDAAKDKELPTAADVLGVLRDAVDSLVDEGDTKYLEGLRRAIADVYVNPRLKALARATPLTDAERKLIGETFQAVADALGKIK